MKDSYLPPFSQTAPDFFKDRNQYGENYAYFNMERHSALYADPERYRENSDQDMVFSVGGPDTLTPYTARPLFDNFWYEGEMACLFGDTNVGKSLLAYQIANSIAAGIDSPVAYFDFENSTHQYVKRYFDQQKNEYALRSDNLYVFNISPYHVFPPKKVKLLLDGIECKIIRYRTPYVIIDDIFHLCSMNDCPSTDFVLRTLRHWTLRYRISILVVAHARRHHHNAPIELRHLCGSQRLTYAFDSIFALNRTFLSRDTLYLKHLKSRNSTITNDSDNVIPIKIDKRPDKPLSFRLVGNPSVTDERMLLNICDPKATAQAREKAQELSDLGWSLREMAEYFGISHTAVRRLLNANQTAPSKRQAEARSDRGVRDTNTTCTQTQGTVADTGETLESPPSRPEGAARSDGGVSDTDTPAVENQGCMTPGHVPPLLALPPRRPSPATPFVNECE